MIDLEWVKDYIDIDDQDLNELAVKITKAGINVEKVISNHIDNVIVGQIVKCKDHPDSDHLHVCDVNIGEKTVQIVCGAPNVRDGLKVIVSLPGAKLPDGEIKKSVIRGIESNGMICALYELGLTEFSDAAYARGIEELPDDAPVGEDALKYLGKDDTLYELDIHKHRNNDCYYHIGFAYEIASILNRKVTLPSADYKEIKENINDYFKLSVKTKKCSYYLAKMVKGVKIGESPEFIKRRLNAYGMRSINNVVDISNYVMLEYGQPLHFFDKETLGDEIVVRNAKKNEIIVTLDGEERILNSSDILITDGKRPVAIAGVMGGENTEVTENTKDILIESAIFDPVSIRYTSANLNLRSESSIRFGKGLSFEYTEKAIERACYLLEKYAGAKVLSGMVCYDKVNKKPKVLKFKTSEINEMLGLSLTDDDVKIELNRLDFPFEYNRGKFVVTVPFRRLDIDPNVNDIAEEVGRLYGYHNLASTLPVCETRRGEYAFDVKYRKLVSRRLRSLGINECKTYTLVSPDMALKFKYDDMNNVVLPNPLSVDKSVVRTTLIPSLINVYEYNKARKVRDILIYEISKVYDEKYNEINKVSILMSGNYIINEWSGVKTVVDFYLIKGIIQNIFDYLGFKNRYSFVKADIPNMHPGKSAAIVLDKKKIGIIGRIHPSDMKDEVYIAEFDLNSLMSKVKPLKFKAASRYPEIRKDVAFVMDKDIPSADVVSVIRKAGGRDLVSINEFDVYTGNNVLNNEKSIAYSLIFSSNERTLSEDEVMKSFDNIIKLCEEKLGVKLRNK